MTDTTELKELKAVIGKVLDVIYDPQESKVSGFSAAKTEKPWPRWLERSEANKTTDTKWLCFANRNDKHPTAYNNDGISLGNTGLYEYDFLLTRNWWKLLSDMPESVKRQERVGWYRLKKMKRFLELRADGTIAAYANDGSVIAYKNIPAIAIRITDSRLLKSLPQMQQATSVLVSVWASIDRRMKEIDKAEAKGKK